MKTLQLQHFSGSTINSFIERRSGFFRSKVLNVPFRTNPSMARGKAVEEYVNAYFDGEQVNPLDLFDRECPPQDNEKYHAIRSSVPTLANLALSFYESEFIQHPLKQFKIEVRLPEVNLPIIGFLDYYQFGKQVRDCKVVERNSSSLSQAYIVTGSLYKLATGCDVYYDLFVNNKKPVHTELKLSDEEYKFGLSYATQACKTLEEIMICEDPDRFFELMCFPNLDEFYDPYEKKDVAEQWGITL